MKNKKGKIKNGFTLIELIIALGIFVILISIAIGGFINALRGQRVAVGLMEINDNMGLVLEQMAREIRMGYNFNQAIGAFDELRFQKSLSKFVIYKLINNEIWRAEAGDFTNLDSALALITNPITAENIKIENLDIIACGENLDAISYPLPSCGTGGIFQPRVTLSIRVTGKGKDVYIEKLGVYNEIQTTISSRQYLSP